ncbi:hypothetical protein GCM10007423_63670 [Dyadobacter endophyticus]|uniref:Uncharacterized protein n=1 Tax=Dyadobacter endophyticus TaxID=1749036 RepID=A0ABQ1ZBY5_9BACT|nr:hypothetical protein [Dyadobacter endophyticus]GGH55767.1 hypothetical protein GCM10007423_63670 [Dyadobacter endophyticus]
MMNLYYTIQEIGFLGVAIGGVASGFRIYQKWGRGEAVIPLIFTWLGGLILAVILNHMIYGLVLAGNAGDYNPISTARMFAKETHSAAITIGLIVAIVAVIHIYHRYTTGDDVTELVYRWVASLFFLFTFGLIIETVLS